MPKQVAVIGLGRFGSTVARTLFQLGHDVLGVDADERLVHEITGQVTHAVQADATDEEALRELDIANFDAVIVAIGGNLEASILGTMLVKRLGARYVVSKARSGVHGEILARVGADKVVYPERDTGVRVAHSFALPNVQDYLDVAPNYGVSKLVPPKHFLGKSLDELNLRSRFGIMVLIIVRGQEIILTPARDEVIREGDVLVVAGRDEQLERLSAGP